MSKLEWCCRQNGGISLIDPNQNLANAYIEKAEDALAAMRANTTKDWIITTSYYSMYFSLYSILMKIGIKCEIHSCTLEFADVFLGDFFDKSEINFLKSSLKARVDAQYYVDRHVSGRQYYAMVEKAPHFLVKCKSILLRINERKIAEVRNGLKAKL